MATITEMAAQILAAQASTTEMTTEELLQQLQKIHATLKALESGETAPVTTEEVKPTLTVKEAFKKNEVICMICNKGGFKTLTRHLTTAHNIKPGAYRKQFAIPAKQPLTAKSASDARRKSALDRGMGDVLAKARAKRAANVEAKKAVAVNKSPRKAKTK